MRYADYPYPNNDSHEESGYATLASTKAQQRRAYNPPQRPVVHTTK